MIQSVFANNVKRPHEGNMPYLHSFNHDDTQFIGNNIFKISQALLNPNIIQVEYPLCEVI